ncbi:hypothetical protein FISHEDRAFT_75395 [Fistulina hepatica ATCC 64428]|uniref:C2H2-type domain-containing protein n=1 Tax=Fistulina hepatica ATCC 64428 TaxID=1128425 RepID=A0A0D7A8H5_9AGAR|nr:hypothetical protein FISHEDRAFT_75395 [Fistulina hepatica ATCC 64428]
MSQYNDPPPPREPSEPGELIHEEHETSQHSQSLNLPHFGTFRGSSNAPSATIDDGQSSSASISVRQRTQSTSPYHNHFNDGFEEGGQRADLPSIRDVLTEELTIASAETSLSSAGSGESVVIPASASPQIPVFSPSSTSSAAGEATSMPSFPSGSRDIVDISSIEAAHHGDDELEYEIFEDDGSEFDVDTSDVGSSAGASDLGAGGPGYGAGVTPDVTDYIAITGPEGTVPDWTLHAEAVSSTDYRCMWIDEQGVSCGYRARKSSTKRHIESKHMGVKKFVCVSCDKKFAIKVSCEDHVAKVHLKM